MTQLKLRVDKLQAPQSEIDDALFETLFVMGQLKLIGSDAAISWERLSGAIGKSKNTVRRIISSLEERDLIQLTSRKLLMLKLSPAGHNFLFTEVETR
ncbi:MAG: Lrp/AsnC family transcriptional regulator [Rothia sp. (in: high G+C Gram-positive bacteria)]|nr:Lrp/AsnC family transcriptional regulator [Rothia sp. (in: high G+C Gram-positive bacteria)]